MSDITTEKALIYGASDDLIELESAELREEWCTAGPYAFLVRAPYRTTVYVTVGFDMLPHSEWVIVISTDRKTVATFPGDEKTTFAGLVFENVGREGDPDHHDPGVQITPEEVGTTFTLDPQDEPF